MNKWSKMLVKDEISDFLIEQIESDISNLTIDELNIIRKKVESIDDVKLLKKIIIENKQKLTESLFEELIEEITEITSDFKWQKTKRGKNVIYINDWTQEFYSEFRSFEKFENVYIGGHSENENVIFITGKVNKENDMTELIDYINSKKPKLELLFKVEIK